MATGHRVAPEPTRKAPTNTLQAQRRRFGEEVVAALMAEVAAAAVPLTAEVMVASVLADVCRLTGAGVPFEVRCLVGPTRDHVRTSRDAPPAG